MRRLACLFALIMGLAPAMQVFAATMAQAHCRANGHITATAPDASDASMHAQHHGDAAMVDEAPDHASMQHAAGDNSCQCGCLCNLACAAGAALAPSMGVAQSQAPEHFQQVAGSALQLATHSVLQRPPIFS